jgi:uroporphyrinogen decarboxylase
MVNHAERLQACLAGEKPDRNPVALWRHFPVDDQSPERFAAALLVYQRTYDFDLVKVTPASSFCLKDWGVDDEWRGASEGTRQYTHPVINHPRDWEHLPVLNPNKGYLAAQLECLRLMIRELGNRTPVIQTVFSPLAQAKNMVGQDALLIHLHRFPEAVMTGLKVIAESTRRFIEAANQTGIAGIFYAVQHAQYGLLTVDEYLDFGRAYDLPVLGAASHLWLNMLHLHGEEVMFDQFVDYPVQIINWHDQESPPSLADGLQLFPGAVCGGLQRERTIVLGTPEQEIIEAQQAIQATNGRRFILGTGCVVPITAPHGNILAVRKCVEEIEAAG